MTIKNNRQTCNKHMLQATAAYHLPNAARADQIIRRRNPFPASATPRQYTTDTMMKINAVATGVSAPGLRFIVYLKFMD